LDPVAWKEKQISSFNANRMPFAFTFYGPEKEEMDYIPETFAL